MRRSAGDAPIRARIEPRRAVRGAARRALRRPRVRRPRRPARGAAGALVERARVGARCRRCVVRRHARGAWRRFAAALAPATSTARWSAITGSNGKTTVKEMIGRDPRPAPGPALRHARQPEQPHRRAAHAAAGCEAGAPLRGDRDGREPPGRDRAPRRDRAARRRRWSSTPRPAHLEGFGGIEARGARARARCSPALGAGGTAVDQCRRPLRRALARARARAGRVLTFGLRPSGRRHARATCGAARRRGLRTDFRAGRRRSASRACDWRCAGEHNVDERAGRRRRGATPPAPSLDADRRGPGSHARRSPAGSRSSRRRAARALIDDTYNANPGSVRAGARARWPALAGRALAGARRHGASSGERGRQLHRGDRRARRAARHRRACYAVGERRPPRGRGLRRRRAPLRSRTRTLIGGAAPRDSRAGVHGAGEGARARAGSSGWSPALGATRRPQAGRTCMLRYVADWLARVPCRRSTSSAT
ncbi:MAG: hypothetical protein MZV65_34510 [Chromatiales bacterium]|nr:hypothetical protein [Chromatiales bacterium]